ncbi:MAG: hypothetical protein CL573_06070 [Alphaproteobacteria bacterium]|nr:hypothetical protein [Alphaproteobacteria bacterium]|tara:strand:- start:777 stop:1364 length:588 start_codon:yes stop_codon:yes gene_type:complete
MWTQRFAVAMLFVSGAIMTTSALAQGVEKLPVPSIAIIDVDKIMQESLAVKSARTQIDEIAGDLQEKIAAEEEAFRSEDQQLQQQRTILTPDVYTERRQDLQARAASFQQRARTLRQTLDRGMAQTMQRIQMVLFDEVGKLAKEIDVNLVLPRSQVVVVFDSLDVSDEALKRLNERLSEIEMSLERKTPSAPAPK